MKRTADRKDSVFALAMTWDGARWPTRSLPPKARAFLGHKSSPLPARKEMAGLFADDRAKEIRICWVPGLRGGDDVLAETFPAPMGKRLRFEIARTRRFRDVLGVVYRRVSAK
jgi:hypothetical protein